jgi:hypothetical protein
MNVYRSSTTMQIDAKYKTVKQSRCMTGVITALRSPINNAVSSRCDPKPGSLTGDAVQFSVGRQPFSYQIMEGLPGLLRLADCCRLVQFLLQLQ